MPSLPAKMKILSILAKTLEKQKLNFSHSALFHMETRVRLKYFVNGCSIHTRQLDLYPSCSLPDPFLDVHLKKFSCVFPNL